MKQTSTKVAEPKFVQLSESQARAIINETEKLMETHAKEVVEYIANKLK